MWLENPKIASCQKCGWIWHSRKGKPERCPNPKCTTSLWNKGNLDFEELSDEEKEEIKYNQSRSGWKLLNLAQRRIIKLEKKDLDEKQEEELEKAKKILATLREKLVPSSQEKLAKALKSMRSGGN